MAEKVIRPIIPTCTDELVLACLESIERSEVGSAGHCIVGDNGLTVNLTDRFPGITVVQVPSDPFIHMRALNAMVGAAGPEDDIVVMGDDSAIVSKGWMSECRSLLTQWPPDIGMMNFVHEGYYGFGDYTSWLASIEKMFTRSLPFRSIWALPLLGSLIPRAMINEFGPFDERYVGYGYDDIDWCVRLLHGGKQIGIVRSVEISHAGGASYSSQKLGHSRDPELMVNKILFNLKWGHPITDSPGGYPPSQIHLNRQGCGCLPRK